MNIVVIDSSVVAKWLLPEADSDKAQRLVTGAAAAGDELVVLDLVYAEVANAIWKRQRAGLLTEMEAGQLAEALARIPVRVEAAARVLKAGFEIARRYDRAVYDALFVAVTQDLGGRGITADEPLYNARQKDYPQIVLLRNM